MPSRGRPFDEQRLVALYVSGLSARQCGEVFGRSASWAQLHLKRLGVRLRATGEAVSVARREPFDEQRLVQLYRSGMSAAACAQVFGHSENWVFRRLRRLGVPIRTLTEAHARSFDAQRLIDLYSGGASLDECGQAFGRSAMWARDHLARLGVRLRTLSETTRLRHQRARATLLPDVEERWRNGETVTTIARAHGVDPKMITARLRDLGLGD